MAIAKQSTVVAQEEINPEQLVSEIALFNPDGTPFTGGGGEAVTGFTGTVAVGGDVLSFEDGVLKSVDPA